MDWTKHFITGKQTDGKPYVWPSQDAPEVLKDYVYEIVQDISDGIGNPYWISATTLEAFEALQNAPRDSVDIEPDIYYHELDSWLSENDFGAYYCNQAVSDGLCDGTDLYETIGYGQYLAKERIYDMVEKFINQNDDYDAAMEQCACDDAQARDECLAQEIQDTKHMESSNE